MTSQLVHGVSLAAYNQALESNASCSSVLHSLCMFLTETQTETQTLSESGMPSEWPSAQGTGLRAGRFTESLLISFLKLKTGFQTEHVESVSVEH